MSSLPTILITGANGQLAQELKLLSGRFPAYHFVFLSKEQFAVTDQEAALALFGQYQPSYLINCAAYTAVDKAETEKEIAHAVNAIAPGMLAGLCKTSGTRFIHISTDYVFSGKAATPYKEDAPVDPQSVYGATKLYGERLTMQNNPASLVVRTSWVYSYFGKNFVKTMLRLMAEKREINVVNDQIGAPTYAADLAEALLHIIVSGKWKAGIYHYSNTGPVSWYDFATAIKEMTGYSCSIHPISSSQYTTPAKRPHYSVLDTCKIAEAYDIAIKDWKESLSLCIARLTEKTQ